MQRSSVPRSIALALACAAGLAVASPSDENVTWAYAQVLRASPVYEMQRVRVPEEQCGPDREGRDGSTGTVAGAVVGGVLGHRVGKGDGRKAATLAGAVLGGVVGRRIDKGQGTRPGCRTVEVEREQRQLVGYDVEYQYKGQTYMSRMDVDPGNRVRVRVSVVPDEPTLR
jgi:uncharacterized protein YcfJ